MKESDASAGVCKACGQGTIAGFIADAIVFIVKRRVSFQGTVYQSVSTSSAWVAVSYHMLQSLCLRKVKCFT